MRVFHPRVHRRGNKDVIEDYGGAKQEGWCYNKSKGKIEDDFFDGMQRATTTINDGQFTAATAKQRCARVEHYHFNDAEWNCGEHEAKADEAQPFEDIFHGTRLFRDG